MADYKIEEIEGIGAVYGPKLQAAGIKTVADLLAKGHNPQRQKGAGRSYGHQRHVDPEVG